MNITKNIKNIAQDVLINKSSAIAKRNQFSDNDFGEFVNEIYSSKGRVVITGVGKNAIIANKIVAIFKSTVCISKNTNSQELTALAPLLERRGTKLVARVCNTNLYLERYANYTLTDNALKAYSCYRIPSASAIHDLAVGDVLRSCSQNKLLNYFTIN